RIPAHAERAFLPIWRMALDRNAGGLSQPTPDALQGDHGRHAGILLRVSRAYLRHRELDQIAADLRRLDNSELVARNVSHFPGKRTTLRADAVPDFHAGRSRRTESILLRNHYDGIASFSRSFRRPFRPRLVGLLISDSILQATRAAKIAGTAKT